MQKLLPITAPVVVLIVLPVSFSRELIWKGKEAHGWASKALADPSVFPQT